MSEVVAYNIPITDKKIVSISSKRQITIPLKYFSLLGFTDEAECVLRGNELVLRPVKLSGGEFAENILEDLIKEGLSGDELLNAFKERQAKIRPAVESMLSDAKKVAEDELKYSTYDDIFGTEEN